MPRFSSRIRSLPSRRLQARVLPTLARRVMPIVGDRDIAAHRVKSVLDAPPIHATDPSVTRIVRMTSQYTGALYSSNISGQADINQDSLDYLGSTSNPRYHSVNIQKVEVWYSSSGEPTNGLYPNLLVTDALSGTTVADTPNGGVDFAHVAIRPCLEGRMRNALQTSTNPIVVVELGPSPGSNGTVTTDVTCTLH